jgi:four helix bundle protein
VYEMSADLADELHEAIKRWPSPARSTIGRQLVRAADSVGANIAEATGRLSSADKRHFLLIARGSLYELEHWLLRAHTRGLIAHPRDDEITEIARMLNGLIRRQGAS